MKRDIVTFNCKDTLRSKSILDELEDLDDFELPSQRASEYKEHKEEKKKEKEKEKESKKKKSFFDDDDYFGDSSSTEDWLASVATFKSPKIKKKNKPMFKGFGSDGEGKKKKKKNKETGVISHKKDFDTELALLKSLQSEHAKFLDSLRKRYNQMEETKSTARGIGKFTTDLITNITSGTTTSLQIIKEIAALKKSVADLDFRERKEFGQDKNSEQTNLTNYASTYLKQVMDVGRNNIIGGPQYEDIGEVEDDGDLFDSIAESLGEDDRDDDSAKFLKYENMDVKVKVLYHDNAPDDDLENKYDFIAYDNENNVIEDYPLPEKTQLNINRSTNICSDIYGNKYEMIMC